MEFRETDAFSEAESDALLDGESDAYGTDDLGITWSEKTHHLLMVDDGAVIGHAGWIEVEMVSDDGDRLPGLGLGGVLVRHDRRGHGLGEALVQEAADRMARLGRPFGFLFCRSARLRFYERNGWRRVAGPVVVEQPSGHMVMPLETCWRPFVGQVELPDGRLRLPALPF